MNAKLFYTLNLFACMGIGACNGMNINRMDDKPIKKEIKEEPGTSSGLNIIKGEKEVKLRKLVVNRLSELTLQKFGHALPESYKNFLVYNDPDQLEKLKLEPFCIFSFDTPHNAEEDLERIVRETMSDQIGMISYFPRVDVSTKRAKFNIKNPWCIAVCSREDEQEDGHDENQEYYYIDISVFEDNSIYKMGLNGSVESINRRLKEFVEFCGVQSLSIKRSLEAFKASRDKK